MSTRDSAVTKLRRAVARSATTLASAAAPAADPRAAAPAPARPATPAPAPKPARPSGPHRVVEGRPVTSVEAPYSPFAPLDLDVAAAVSPRLAELLAPEWRQHPFDRHGWRATLEGTAPDLVLVEHCAGAVTGWTGAVDELVTALSAARDAGARIALWVTDRAVPPTELLVAADVVGGVDETTVSALEGAGTAAQLWPAAGQPRQSGLARDDETTTRRGGALLVVDGFGRLGDDTALREVARGIAPLPPSQAALVRLSGKSASVTLPPTLAERQVAHGPWAAEAGVLADARVLVDLGDGAPGSAWTTVAAATARTPVVGLTSLASAAPPEIAALVPRVEDEKSLRSEVVARIHQEELVSREGLLLQRAVLEGHTAAHRARAITQAVLPERATPLTVPTISAVVPTNRTHELDNVFANLGRQRHEALELVLVLHGLDTDDEDLRRRAQHAGVEHLTLVHADAGLTLGACMNLGVDAASGQYVAKMDDDNIYGPGYLSDLLATFAYTDAGVVGKWAHYVWLRSTGAVVLRYPDSEHRYERRIQGGSMLFAGDVVRDVRFSDIPRAVDSDILDRSAEAGVRIYSGDRYNYVSVRGDDRLAHTWTVTDSTFFTATGRLLFYGDPTTHVSI